MYVPNIEIGIPVPRSRLRSTVCAAAVSAARMVAAASRQENREPLPGIR
jgi:hypothetical protein